MLPAPGSVGADNRASDDFEMNEIDQEIDQEIGPEIDAEIDQEIAQVCSSRR